MPRTQTRRPQPQQEERGTSNALTTTEAQTKALTAVAHYVTTKRDQLAMLLAKGVDVDRFITVALAAVQGQPKLLECSPLSIFTAIREAATWGLELGPLGDASLVPYLGEAQLSVEYRGYRRLSLRDGTVKAIAADVVYTKDQFRIISGTEGRGVFHEPSLESERGNVVGAYAWARLANGEVLYVWMTEQELYKRRDVSRSWQTALKYGRTDSIWHLWPIEMMRKTVLRRLCSEQLPLTPLMREVMVHDLEVDTVQPERQALPAGTLQGADARARILSAMGLDQQPAALPAPQQQESRQAAPQQAAAAEPAQQGGPPPPEAPRGSDSAQGAAEAHQAVDCGAPNPYDQAGAACHLAPGHPGHHQSAEHESW